MVLKISAMLLGKLLDTALMLQNFGGPTLMRPTQHAYFRQAIRYMSERIKLQLVELTMTPKRKLCFQNSAFKIMQKNNDNVGLHYKHT